MRVIAGTAGRVILETPSTDLRPTMDKVKGAIFSSLGEAIIGARVLDLFSGSGGIGIEALSRGASSAVLVEKNHAATEIIRKNLIKTKLQAEVVQRDVYTYLQHAPEKSFDFIFADPPYLNNSLSNSQPEDHTAKLLSHLHLPNLLAEDGWFILEKAPNYKLSESNLWHIERSRRYGYTEVIYCVPKL